MSDEVSKTGRRKGPSRAKLTHQLLIGPNGVDKILKELSSVEFRHESTPEAQEENIRLLLHKYEAWGKLMVPQLGFDEFLASLERLSSKADFRKRMENIEVGLSFALDVQMQQQVEASEQQKEQETEIQQPSSSTETETHTVVLNEEQRKLIEERRQHAIELRTQKSQQSQTQSPQKNS